MIKRGGFLLGAISGLSIAASADSLFGTALAQPVLPGLPGGVDDRVLVVVNFQGGNDGLNTIVPHGMQEYYRYRPSIGIPASDVLTLNAQIGFNPALRSLKAMYDRGDVAVIQGAGYPKPDHSHFRSTEIWQTGVPDKYESTGWMGRYLDAAGLPQTNLFNGVAISDVVPETMIARTIDVPAIGALRAYTLASDKTERSRTAFSSLVKDNQVPFRSPYLATVASIEDHAQRGSEELPKLIAGYKTDAQYPATPLGRSLALAAQIVGSRLGTRVIYVQHGSFDTHSGQRATQDRLLREFADATSAFYGDLAAHGNDKRVLTMTFSEFGRRVAENGSRGTDHGEAAPMFMIGGGVKGGIYGDHPSLAQLDNGDVTFTTDFRSVYSTIIEKWFGRSSSEVIAGQFATLSMLA